jgi:hypothetical protein
MNAVMAKLHVRDRWRAAKSLTVFAAYEDSFTAARGLEFCRALAKALGQDCKIMQHVWLFDEFRVPKLKEIAAGEAAVADLVVISAHRHEDLPQELKAWMEMWLALGSRRPPVILALLDPAAPGLSGAIETYLEDVAKSENIEFLVSRDESQGDQPSYPE